MKKQLLYLLLAICSITTGNSQTIGLVGTGANGWPGDPLPAPQPDIMMSTTDNINFTLTDQVISTGEVKFRQDQMWTTSWGSTSFPSGTGTLGGPNIPTIAGTYTINFNIQTGAYSFVGTPAFASIGIWGPAVDPLNGFGGPDVKMVTTDGIHYVLSAFTFTSGDAKFRKNDDPLLTYGSTGFPTGTAVADGPNFYVPGGQYTVYFNLDTGDYSFEYPSVGIIGSAVNGWDPAPDSDLTTTDGISYYLTNYALLDGELKFRLDNSWTTNWGTGGIVPNVLVPNGNNIPVSAGNYDIYFNRNTLEYSITPSLGIGTHAITTLSVYPNPAVNAWNISSREVIASVAIYNSIGRKVLELNPVLNQTSIDASGLASGVYFAKVTAGGRLQTVKLIKE